MPRRVTVIGILLFLFFSCASEAQAHLILQDSALFSGIVNSLIHIPSLLLLLAFGCRAGQHFNKHPPAQWTDMLWFLGPMALGSFWGLTGLRNCSAGPVLALASITGLLTTLDFNGNLFFLRIVSIVCGIGWGIYTAAEVQLPFYKCFFFMSGSLITAGTIVFFLVLSITRIENRAVQLGVRIAGSWITAMTAMMLAYWALFL